MEILSLKIKSKTNPNVFIVKTQDGDFLLHSDVIVSKGITKGEIDDVTFLEATRESEVLIATAVAMKYLGSHLKTEKGVKDYLKKKEFSQYAITETTKKMVEYGVIDDRTFAESYIKSNSNFSRLKLREKLKLAGVDRSIVEELTIDIDDTEACKKNASKFLRNKTLDKQTKEKLYRRLRGMGYSFETINSTLGELMEEEW